VRWTSHGGGSRCFTKSFGYRLRNAPGEANRRLPGAYDAAIPWDNVAVAYFNDYWLGNFGTPALRSFLEDDQP